MVRFNLLITMVFYIWFGLDFSKPKKIKPIEIHVLCNINDLYFSWDIFNSYIFCIKLNNVCNINNLLYAIHIHIHIYFMIIKCICVYIKFLYFLIIICLILVQSNKLKFNLAIFIWLTILIQFVRLHFEKPNKFLIWF